VADRPLVRRRTAVTGALGGLALLAGCDHGDDLVPPRAGSTAPTPTQSAEAPEQTPDEALVDAVLGQLSTALAVAINSWKAPELRRSMGTRIRAHRQHIKVLEGELPAESPPGPPPDPAAALHAVRAGEQQLQTALVDAAGRAESGALARLLASMSASVTQHLATLPKAA
jgi:hypothetical protein